MAQDVAALLERIEILEGEVQVLRAVNKDVDAGIEALRDAGMNADRTLMEVSRIFAFALVTRMGGEFEVPMDALESFVDDRAAKVTVLLDRDVGRGIYRARAATRDEAGRVAPQGPGGVPGG